MKKLNKNTISSYNVNENAINNNLLKIIATSNPEDLNIEFEHHDGTFRNIPVHKTFFQDDTGKELKPFKIISKINTLKHDFGAKKFNVTNLSKK